MMDKKTITLPVEMFLALLEAASEHSAENEWRVAEGATAAPYWAELFVAVTEGYALFKAWEAEHGRIE